MTTTSARWFQLFKLKGNTLANMKGQVIEVVGAVDAENRNVGVNNAKGGMAQEWDIIYVDEMPAALKIGEENKDWGFKINSPFYVVSKKARGYFLDLLGNNMVMKTRNGMTSQQWYFDQKTRTIKSVRTPSKSWDIQSSGKASNLNVYSTNSGWW